MKPKMKRNILNVLHYAALFSALVLCLLIGYFNFIQEVGVSEEKQEVKTEVKEEKDSSQIYIPERMVDSMPPTPQPYSMDDIPKKSDNEADTKENREVEVNPSKDKSQEAKTWIKLIIDLLETLTPLLLPIVSYYFKPNAVEET